MPAQPWIALAVVGILTAGCGGDDTAEGSGLSGEVTVFAAASLTEAFFEIGDAFEAANAEAKLTFNFGPSSGLATQLGEGAPADVFASADETSMQKAVDRGAVATEPEIFAQNVLEIAVPAGNPGDVTGLEDFARSHLLVGLCAEEAPCGRLARQVLDQAGVTAAVDTNEPDVRALLTKIEAGELDAGLVYRTDVRAVGDRVEGIEIADDDNVMTSYPIAPVATTANEPVATAFITFVLSGDGQAILADYGFLEP